MRRQLFFNQAVLSPFCFHFYSPVCFSVAAIVQWNRCPHDLGLILVDTYTHTHTLPLLLLGDAFTLAAPSLGTASINVSWIRISQRIPDDSEVREPSARHERA